MSQAMKSERLFIDGHVGRLEALLEIPADEDNISCVAVVCHPHPLHQGTMLNKVAHMVARTFVDLGVPALRFNFRGVGRSEGEFDDAIGEQQDAIAALDFMQQRWPGSKEWLGGFSFGAQVSLAVAAIRPLDWLVTVAPPIMRLDLATFQRPDVRWLVVQGTDDELVDAEAVHAWVDSMNPQPALEIIESADHFFHGKLVLLREAIRKHAI